jgi:hypothetical protein
MDSDPVKIAGSWLTLNAHIRSYFNYHPEKKQQYLMVRYEDIKTDPKNTIKQVCKCLGIDFHNDMLASLDQRWGRNTKPEYPEEIYELMRQVAVSELKEYDYV